MPLCCFREEPACAASPLGAICMWAAALRSIFHPEDFHKRLGVVLSVTPALLRASLVQIWCRLGSWKFFSLDLFKDCIVPIFYGLPGIHLLGPVIKCLSLLAVSTPRFSSWFSYFYLLYQPDWYSRSLSLCFALSNLLICYLIFQSYNFIFDPFSNLLHSYNSVIYQHFQSGLF